MSACFERLLKRNESWWVLGGLQRKSNTKYQKPAERNSSNAIARTNYNDRYNAPLALFFVGLETARWELYLRFYNSYFNSCFDSLNIYIYIRICIYNVYKYTPLYDYVCKTTCEGSPPLDLRFKKMVMTWIFVGRIFWEQTTNPRNHGCIYIRITQLTILLRANLPFYGSDLPKSFMVGDTPHTLNQLNLPYCLRTEDLVEELQWILGQEEEQIVVMPRPKVTPSFRASSGWVEFTKLLAQSLESQRSLRHFGLITFNTRQMTRWRHSNQRVTAAVLQSPEVVFRVEIWRGANNEKVIIIK